MKKRLSAVTPNIPLNQRNFLMLPNGLIPYGRRYAKLRMSEIRLRNRINSCVGKWCRNFTHSCISENANVLTSMKAIPFDMLRKFEN